MAERELERLPDDLEAMKQAVEDAGGIKVIRFLLMYKQGRREIQRLIHPNAIITIKMGERPVSDRVVDAVWGFFATYATSGDVGAAVGPLLGWAAVEYIGRHDITFLLGATLYAAGVITVLKTISRLDTPLHPS